MNTVQYDEYGNDTPEIWAGRRNVAEMIEQARLHPEQPINGQLRVIHFSGQLEIVQWFDVLEVNEMFEIIAQPSDESLSVLAYNIPYRIALTLTDNWRHANSNEPSP